MFYFTGLAMGSAWALGAWLFLAETAETWPGPRGALCSGSWFWLFFESPVSPGAFGGVGSAPNSWDLEKCLASDLNFLWLQLCLLSLHLVNEVPWSVLWFSYWHILSLIASSIFGDRLVLSGRSSQEQRWIRSTQLPDTHHQSHRKLSSQATLQSQG